MSQISIIPKPNRVLIGEGMFCLNSSTVILIEEETIQPHSPSLCLIGSLKYATAIKLSVKKNELDNSDSNYILFKSVSKNSVLGEEGYKIEIYKSSLIITGKPIGQFYAVQSLLQLIPASVFSKVNNSNIKEFTIPCLSIIDKPRFVWRGMHLDVARHLFSLSFIKKYIDYLSIHKMNIFHWHLTDDQGWRIEIKKYPQLTKVGAFRNETLIGHYNEKPHRYDNKQYGGFYTQTEIKEIVKYAKDRYVTIVPEIEMPGHSIAALASYPNLSCTGEKMDVTGKWGIFDDIYCAGNEQVFDFLEDVLTEIFELFPSQYIHIGGDEAPKTRWENCKKCRKRIKDEGLKNSNELQSYFISRIERFITSKGRKIIGWDEIMEGGLAPNATVMSWQGTKGGIAAAKAGHNAVMSPESHCYLNYNHNNSKNEPLAFGAKISVNKIYNYEPIPNELTKNEAAYILGVQANLWTEYINNSMKVEYMALPRMCAIAEVAWTDKELREFDDFNARLQKHKIRMDFRGMNYFPKNRHILLK